jgi:hypothetical protein
MKISFQGFAELQDDEGTRLFVYDDATGAAITKGSHVIGWPTVATGRNLAGKGVSATEACMMLANDVAECEAVCAKLLGSVWPTLPPVVVDVCIMVQFNTGNLAGWPGLLSHVRSLYWQGAHDALLDSEVARGIGAKRYGRFANAVLYQSWNEADWVPAETQQIADGSQDVSNT